MNSAIGRQDKHLYEFGAFQLDPVERILARAGERIPLAPKAFDTLVVLVRQSGHVLTKDELMKAVWPDSFVEENNLNQNISALRKALGGGPGEQDYIETVPRFGYRFAAPVRKVAAESDKFPLSVPVTGHIVVGDEKQKEMTVGEEGSRRRDVAPGEPHQGRGYSRRFAFLRMPAALSLLLLLGLGIYWYGSKTSKLPVTPPTPTVATRVSVAVLGFRNLSANPGDDWLSTALAEMLTTELAAGERLRTVSGEDIARMKADLRLVETNGLSKTTLTKVRNSLGADLTVSGSYTRLRGSEEKIRLDLQLQDTTKGETVGSIVEVGNVADLFQLVSRSGAQLRARLGAPAPSGTEEGESRAALPSTLETAQLYSEGLAKLRAFDAPAAQVLLAKAVSADPDYTLGHSALAAAWSALGYDEKAKAEAKRALDLSENMSRADRLLIAGRYSEMTSEWDKAVETYQLLFSFFPDNLEYGLRLAGAQTSGGKGKDALATVEKLRRLPPPAREDPQIDFAEVAAAESLGDFKRERQAAEIAVKKGENLGERLLVARSLFKQGWALSRMGEPQQALDVLGKAKGLFDAAGDKQGAASTLRVVATVLLGQGNYTKTKQTCQEALQIFKQIGDKRGMAQSLNTLAIAHYEQGDLEEAKALFEQSLQIQREVASKTNIAGALGNIAEVLDAEGKLAEARKLTDESVKVFVEVGDQRALGTALGNLGDILYEQGELSEAKKAYEAALKIKSKIGYQRGVAYDLSGISRVLAAEGDIANAQKEEQEALAIRNKIGEKHNAAVSNRRLAELALQEGDASQAETLARQAAQEFNEDGSSADEAFAQIVVARTLLKEGKLIEAEETISRVSALSRSNLSRPLHFELSLAAAYVNVAGRGPSNRARLAESKEMLNSSLAEARRYGYLGYQLKLRLALGDIEIRYGSAEAGRAELEAVARDANAKGFGLVASNAVAAANLKSEAH